MAEPHSFRSAFHGFNREDVVRYIEYVNIKHQGIVNQLCSEKQALLEELNAMRVQLVQLQNAFSALEQERNALQEQLAAAEQAEPNEAQAEIEALKTQLEAALAGQAQRDISAEELEAYRRAERMERAAKERAENLYRQATATLADATAQVDGAASQFREIADRVNAQMCELQSAVEGSKAALLEAATTMYTIRPEGTEE